MIAIIIVLSSIGLIAIFMTSPHKHVVHAARAQWFPANMKTSSRMSPLFLFSGASHILGSKNLFYGEALGSSMEHHGIQDGAEFIGECISACLLYTSPSPRDS